MIECFDILGKVTKNRFTGFLHEILEISADGYGRVLLFEGSEEAGFDSIPDGLVSSKGLQAVPPGLGLASVDAG
jgi:hypothetical protein